MTTKRHIHLAAVRLHVETASIECSRYLFMRCGHPLAKKVLKRRARSWQMSAAVVYMHTC